MKTRPLLREVEIPSSVRVQLDLLWSANLDVVMQKMMRVHRSFSAKKVGDLMVEYRRFLTLILLYGQVPMTSPLVDEVWHTHILFTREYAEFSQSIFGFFLHHQPSTDGIPDADVANAENFTVLYEQTFGGLAPVWREGLFRRLSKAFRDKFSRQSGTLPALCVPTRVAPPLCYPTGKRSQLVS